jgi:8-oxo-dGTP pyrophosphatase MutT (NUDIX family)
MNFNDYIIESLYLSEREYWGNMGAGIVPYAMDTKKFLLALRSEEVDQPGTWGVIGGKVDEGETNPKEAAMREFEEEMGFSLDGASLELINVFNSREKDEKGRNLFNYYTFVAYLQHELPELETREYGWETDTCKWFSIEELELARNLHFGVKDLLKRKKLQKVV